jgi:hypothetical protein
MATHPEKNSASPANPSVDDDGIDRYGQDEKDMARMGKKQEFKRNFNWISSVGFTSCTMGTWEFVALNNFQMLVDGGIAGMFWSYTVSIILLSTGVHPVRTQALPAIHVLHRLS